MSGFPDSATGYCYRHPSRQSFVLCQRCGRTICPDCQTVAPVGVICPECMKEQRGSYSRPSPARRAARRFAGYSRGGSPVMTWTLMGVCVIVSILQSVPGIGASVTDALQYAGIYSYPSGTLPGLSFQPWRLVTAVFAHRGFLHLALNMYTLWVFGNVLEPLLGRWRYLSLFLLAGVAGSDGVLLLASPLQGVVGASGALFGMMGALLIIQRRLGGPTTQLFVLLAINLALGFVIGNIAWQAHVGGLIGGALVGLVFVETRQVRRQRLQTALLAVLGVVFVGVGVYPLFLG